MKQREEHPNDHRRNKNVAGNDGIEPKTHPKRLPNHRRPVGYFDRLFQMIEQQNASEQSEKQ